MKSSARQAGLTLVETIVAVAVTGVILAGAAVGTVTLQKSSHGARRYAAAVNNSSRMIDYITRDLRSATKVSKVVSGSASAFLKQQSLEITESNHLYLEVPDYYLSNVPDNSAGSNYKTARYHRSQIPSGQSYYSYDTVVEVFGVTRVPRYPATIQVRYVRRARSGSDPTVCFYRQEYEGGTMRLEQEIAESVAGATVRLVTPDSNQAFQVTSDFSSPWTGEAARKAARQFVTVRLVNTRRDLK